MFYTNHILILVEQTVNLNCGGAFVDSQMQIGLCQTTNDGAEDGEADCAATLSEKSDGQTPEYMMLINELIAK